MQADRQMEGRLDSCTVIILARAIASWDEHQQRQHADLACCCLLHSVPGRETCPMARWRWLTLQGQDLLGLRHELRRHTAQSSCCPARKGQLSSLLYLS